MKTPPLSGPALRALVAAAESPLTGDVLLALMRKEARITDLLAVPVDADDAFPLDQRPLGDTTPGGAR